MNKQAVRVLYVDLLYSYELIVLYGPPKPSFGRSPFFFSGLMTGPTYRPLVRHSNADTPLQLGLLISSLRRKNWHRIFFWSIIILKRKSLQRFFLRIPISSKTVAFSKPVLDVGENGKRLVKVTYTWKCKCYRDPPWNGPEGYSIDKWSYTFKFCLLCLITDRRREDFHSQKKGNASACSTNFPWRSRYCSSL